MNQSALLSRFRYTLDYENQRLRFEVGAVFGTRVPFDASSRSILLAAGNLRFLLDTGATGFFLFRSEGLDLEVSARAIKRVSTNAGHRIGKSGWLERLDIGDVSLHRVPVTLVPETGLESKADGLLPGRCSTRSTSTTRTISWSSTQRLRHLALQS